MFRIGGGHILMTLFAPGALVRRHRTCSPGFIGRAITGHCWMDVEAVGRVSICGRSGVPNACRFALCLSTLAADQEPMEHALRG